MEFRTELLVRPVKEAIALSDKIVTIGSCFADDIGGKLKGSKFVVSKNPFGTIYNPISIHRLLKMAIWKSSLPEDGLLERDGFFFHFDFHSQWNDSSPESLKSKLKKKIEEIHDGLCKAKYLIITYGSAWVYEHQSTKSIVANCHKMPQHYFEKQLLTQEDVVRSFEGFYREFKKTNPDCRVILTVSPVRHIKDTLELNSVSKSILRLSCHTLTATYPDVDYFPAYEIMLDDLRDYRFYKPDMIHPSDQAVDYIWEKFTDVFFDRDAKEFIHEWNKIRTALHHKPFHQDSHQHQIFLRDILRKLEEMKSNADVEEEIEMVKGQLKAD